MKSIHTVEIILWFLYLTSPFSAAIIFYFVSTKITEKFVGRKIFYDEDFSAKIISYLSLAVFAAAGYYVYTSFFYKIYSYAANFDRDDFTKFVAIPTFILTFIFIFYLLYRLHEKFFKESDNLPQIVAKIYVHIAVAISAVAAFIVSILVYEVIGKIF